MADPLTSIKLITLVLTLISATQSTNAETTKFQSTSPFPSTTRIDPSTASRDPRTTPKVLPTSSKDVKVTFTQPKETNHGMSTHCHHHHHHQRSPAWSGHRWPAPPMSGFPSADDDLDRPATAIDGNSILRMIYRIRLPVAPPFPGGAPSSLPEVISLQDRTVQRKNFTSPACAMPILFPTCCMNAAFLTKKMPSKICFFGRCCDMDKPKISFTQDRPENLIPPNFFRIRPSKGGGSGGRSNTARLHRIRFRPEEESFQQTSDEIGEDFLGKILQMHLDDDFTQGVKTVPKFRQNKPFPASSISISDIENALPMMTSSSSGRSDYRRILPSKSAENRKIVNAYEPELTYIANKPPVITDGDQRFQDGAEQWNEEQSNFWIQEKSTVKPNEGAAEPSSTAPQQSFSTISEPHSSVNLPQSNDDLTSESSKSNTDSMKLKTYSAEPLSTTVEQIESKDTSTASPSDSVKSRDDYFNSNGVNEQSRDKEKPVQIPQQAKSESAEHKLPIVINTHSPESSLKTDLAKLILESIMNRTKQNKSKFPSNNINEIKAAVKNKIESHLSLTTESTQTKEEPPKFKVDQQKFSADSKETKNEQGKPNIDQTKTNFDTVWPVEGVSNRLKDNQDTFPSASFDKVEQKSSESTTITGFDWKKKTSELTGFKNEFDGSNAIDRSSDSKSKPGPDSGKSDSQASSTAPPMTSPDSTLAPPSVPFGLKTSSSDAIPKASSGATSIENDKVTGILENSSSQPSAAPEVKHFQRSVTTESATSVAPPVTWTTIKASWGGPGAPTCPKDKGGPDCAIDVSDTTNANGTFVHVTKRRLDYESARQACLARNMTLAQLTTATDEHLLRQCLTSDQPHWIGLSRNTGDRSMHWESGEQAGPLVQSFMSAPETGQSINPARQCTIRLLRGGAGPATLKVECAQRPMEALAICMYRIGQRIPPKLGKSY